MEDDKKLLHTVCKVCNRKLKNPKAIELGMGAVCFKKFQHNNHKKLWEEENDNEKYHT